MSHNLDLLDNGEARLALSGSGAWHSLGTVVPAGTLNVKNGLQIAKCDWVVVKVPILWNGKETGFYHTIREEDAAHLGIVGERFTLIQNAVQLEFLDSIVGGNGNAVLETVGAIQGGRKVFVTCKLPFESTLPGLGGLDFHLFVSNAHDGDQGCRAQLCRTRVVCNNTWSFGQAEARKLKAYMTVRHTRNYADQMKEAARILGLAQGAAEASEAEALRLFKTTIEISDAKAFFGKLSGVDALGEDASKRAVTMATKVYDQLFANYRRDDEAEIFGTAWGLMNAVTRYDSHQITGRNTTASTAAESRLMRLLGTQSITAQAAELLGVS